MMKRHFAISAIGRDKPGIVAGLSKVLYDLGANIEDSSMTILMGQFAMILIVSAESSITASLFEESFQKTMDELGLFVAVEELSEDQLRDTGVFTGAPHVISVIGADKPGIVYRLSKLLATKGINITDMKTKVIEGESTPVYTMIMEVAIPEDVKVPALKRELSMLGKEMNIEINLREVEFLEL